MFWKIFARDLPMRDGNFWRSAPPGRSIGARDLPMRDGNRQPSPVVPLLRCRPRPSYEGWKQKMREGITASEAGPRPSYEGWKLESFGLPYLCSRTPATFL